MSIFIVNKTVCGLFRFADQDGIPVAYSITLCEKHKLTLNFSHYIAEAWLAGHDDAWTEKQLNEGFCDAGTSLRFNWAEIKKTWQEHFTRSGAKTMNEWAETIIKQLKPA
jgi:hypothetical protein